uniref:Uncharacterized protein n=1 Tax=Anguilla anguilla TaxID=7936 RepID=A0A0E9QML5_ANGAN
MGMGAEKATQLISIPSPAMKPNYTLQRHPSSKRHAS